MTVTQLSRVIFIWEVWDNWFIDMNPFIYIDHLLSQECKNIYDNLLQYDVTLWLLIIILLLDTLPVIVVVSLFSAVNENLWTVFYCLYIDLILLWDDHWSNVQVTLTYRVFDK